MKSMGMGEPFVVFVALVLCAIPFASRGAEKELWLEAESFASLGGWVIDQQSTAQMGSAYVMAHGMGIPVQDAETVCFVPESGEWTVWARTRDWTAPWKRGKPAGMFKIKVNDRDLPETLGTNGNPWGWQKAGTAALEKGNARIALHDLTGFNGRCDAMYLTLDPLAQPENDPQKLAAFRRKITKTVCKDDPVVYDLAVAGGGIAGICTAIAAMRTGSTVVLNSGPRDSGRKQQFGDSCQSGRRSAPASVSSAGKCRGGNRARGRRRRDLSGRNLRGRPEEECLPVAFVHSMQTGHERASLCRGER